MNKGLRTALIIFGVLVLLGASFYGGTMFGKQQAQASMRQGVQRFQTMLAEGDQPDLAAGEGAFRRFGGQGAAQGGGVVGPIEAIEGDVIIVTDFSGTQRRVQVTDTTLIEKYASVTVGELEIGEQVMVSGSQNDDGSVTARSIQVAPAGRFAPGAAGQGASQ